MKIKVLFAILLCLILTLCLVSCSSDDTDGSDSLPDVQDSIDSENGNTDSDTPSEVYYTVTFITGCDSSIEPISVKEGDKIPEPQAITRDGYSLTGWYLGEEAWSFDESTVTQDITLSAKWSPKTNSIIFDANGGEGDTPSQKLFTGTSASLTLNGFTKAGYQFAGWSSAADGEVEYTDGASYTMGTSSTYILYAVWRGNENTLKFNANGGEGVMSDMTIATGASATLTPNSFTKTGYKLAGWSTTASGEVQYTDGASYTMGAGGSYTLYAIWEVIEYTITYEKNGGSDAGFNPTKFTINDLPVKLNGLTKSKHIFCGWYNESSFTTGIINEITEVGDITLYAEFVEGTSGLLFAENNGAYTVTGYAGEISEVLIPRTYKGKPVVGIGSFAFSYCSTLTSIEIPDSIQAIDSYAFLNCSSLTRVILPSNLNALGNGIFYACSALEKIDLPSSVASIGDDAFRGCTGLASIEIPSSVSTIGVYAFRDCSALSSITIPSGITSIGDYAFLGCSKLSDILVDNDNLNYKSIDGSLYSYDEKTLLQYALGKKDSTFTIPSAVTSIGVSAFEGCTNIVNIIMPEGVARIGDYAFSSCTNLASINIPTTVTSIGWFSFQNCTGLTYMIIPDSVTSMGYFAFQGCTNVIIYCQAENSPRDWESSWSSGCAVEMGILSYGKTDSSLIWVERKNETVAIVYCDKNSFSLSIPSSINGSEVVEITKYVFKNCTNLTSITIPSTVSTIGLSQFEGCTSLTIYCEAPSQPSGWDSTWNKSKCPIVWDCNNSYTSSDGYMYTVVDGIRYRIKGTTTEVAIQAKNIKEANIAKTITYNGQEYTVTKLGNDAFKNCIGLTSISLPSSITSIGSNAIYGCTSLVNISVNEESTKYQSIDGHLYSKDGKTLTQYAIGRAETEFVIPSTVTTISGYAFYACPNLTSIVIPSSMTSISQNAFYGCTSLVSVTMHDNVTSLGNSAFRDCINLSSIPLSSTLKTIGSNTFQNCISLTDITFPNTLVTINGSAFYGCTGLTSIIIPNSVTTIGGSSFRDCTNLSSITLPSALTSLGDNAFRNCVILDNIILPDGITVINNSTFYDCKALTSITIPNGVTSIGSNAFQNCISLTDITLPNALEKINGSAFYGCTGLTSIVLPNSVTSIGGSAFRDCKNLSSITLSSALTSLGDSAFRNCLILDNIILPSGITVINNSTFYDCKALTSITVPNGVTSIGSNAFQNCSSLINVTLPDSLETINGSAFYGCSKLFSITLPSKVVTIGNSAFQNCSSLTSIVIPNGVTAIGNNAFQNCTSLSSITLPSELTSIGNSAFQGCTALSSVSLPDTVASLGNNAFYGCSNLASIIIPISVTSIGSNAFQNCSGLTIYCEAEAKPEGWNESWNSSNLTVVWSYTKQ